MRVVTYQFFEDDNCIFVYKNTEDGVTIHFPDQIESETILPLTWKQIGIWKIKNRK